MVLLYVVGDAVRTAAAIGDDMLALVDRGCPEHGQHKPANAG
mgnify:CR=1 FL=1|jgi:hypothetical protein